jgi:hypothetical protein
MRATMAILRWLKVLSDPCVDPANEDDSAFRLACMTGNVQTVKLLLSDARVNPATNDNIAMILASDFGLSETVKLLLSHTRVDPAAHDDCAIRFANDSGRTDTVKLLWALMTMRFEWPVRMGMPTQSSCFCWTPG